MLHSLDSRLRKVEDWIRKKQLAGFENKNIYLKVKNPDLTKVDIGLIDDEEVNFVKRINSVTKELQGFQKSRASMPESLSTYLLKFKKNLVYNVLWTVAHVLAAGISCYYIKTAFDSWQSSPVVQATSNNQIDTKNISFPAITVCRPFRFNTNYDFNEQIKHCIDCDNELCSLKTETCDHSDVMTLIFAYMMCSKYLFEKPLPSNIKGYITKYIDGKESENYMVKLLASCESDLINSKLAEEKLTLKSYTRCDSNVFQQFVSPHGSTCMTFNSLRHKDIFEDNVATLLPMAETYASETPLWSFDNMMEFKGGLNTTPKYGLTAYAFGINKHEDDHANICKYITNELASVTIHNPNEIPLDTQYVGGISVRENIHVEILLTPKITLAKDLDQYSPQQRGCYFSNENKLAMFKFYTKNNCDIECFINSSLSYCGCVPILYPRPNNDVKLCLRSCEAPSLNCGCLPECNSLKYEVTTQESPWISGYSIGNVSFLGSVDIKFKDNEFYTNVRYNITSRKEFLAYSLGVLGAFLGISVTCVWQLVHMGIAGLWTHVRNPLRKAISPLTQREN